MLEDEFDDTAFLVGNEAVAIEAQLKDASPLSPQEPEDVLNPEKRGLLENDQMKRGEERS